MIQANELRIGNWVQVGDNIELQSIVIAIGSERCHLQGNVILNKYEQLTPIPLTEEILLKCGFELREVTIDGKTHKHYSDFKSVAIEVLSKDFFMLGIHKGYEDISSIKRVESLHQLQNLYFALTNTEPEINL